MQLNLAGKHAKTCQGTAWPKQAKHAINTCYIPRIRARTGRTRAKLILKHATLPGKVTHAINTAVNHLNRIGSGLLCLVPTVLLLNRIPKQAETS